MSQGASISLHRLKTYLPNNFVPLLPRPFDRDKILPTDLLSRRGSGQLQARRPLLLEETLSGQHCVHVEYLHPSKQWDAPLLDRFGGIDAHAAKHAIDALA